MIPDFQTLMRPVLEQSAKGESHISEVVAALQETCHEAWTCHSLIQATAALQYRVSDLLRI